MASITYDELERRVSLDTKQIVELCNLYMKVSASYFSLILFIIQVSYTSFRLTLHVRNIEKHCVVCDKKECTIKNDLRVATDTLYECADRIMKLKIPSSFLALIRYSADTLDNKSENLWLASDNDLRSSISQLAKKMNQ